MDDRIQIKAAYERMPVGLKGAFVLRGGDGQPHQLRLVAAQVTEWTGKGSERIPIDPAIIEVAPTLDTFVPFEVSTLDLGPGWYRIELDVVIDAVEAVAAPGPRFCVPWPRGTVRRGTVAVDDSAGGVDLGSLECAGDAIRVTFQADEVPTVVLFADGSPHPVLEIDLDDTGKGKIVAYPAMRDQDRLSIELNGATPVEVPLP